MDAYYLVFHQDILYYVFHRRSLDSLSIQMETHNINFYKICILRILYAEIIWYNQLVVSNVCFICDTTHHADVMTWKRFPH